MKAGHPIAISLRWAAAGLIGGLAALSGMQLSAQGIGGHNSKAPVSYAADRIDEADGVLSECLMRAPEDEGCLIIKVAVQVGRGQLDAVMSEDAVIVRHRAQIGRELALQRGDVQAGA